MLIFITLKQKLCASLHRITNLMLILSLLLIFQLKVNNEIDYGVIRCYGVTKDPNENDYLLVFEYAKNGDLHNHLSKNFKEITWENKIQSLHMISEG